MQKVFLSLCVLAILMLALLILPNFL
jgi:hypothetical protein